jgi:hypothetical protein
MRRFHGMERSRPVPLGVHPTPTLPAGGEGLARTLWIALSPPRDDLPPRERGGNEGGVGWNLNRTDY